MPKPGERAVEYVKVTCPCGEEFETPKRRIEQGRGRYCSRDCMYRYRVRPTGLKYEIKNENPGWFKPGRPQETGEGNVSWKGEDVSYKELHRWVAKHKQKTGVCENCGTSDAPTEWSNKSHEYRRDLNDWSELCKKCHGAHDSGEARGAATRKYGRDAVQRGCG
jgi:hypothetical protein